MNLINIQGIFVKIQTIILSWTGIIVMIIKESMSVLNSPHTQEVRDAAFSRWGCGLAGRESPNPRKGLVGLRKHACSCLAFLVR